MVSTKSIKSASYFSKFQVKFRRRREGKTDYRARVRLVIQDKNKYATPRYRLVVRFSNRDITTQVTSATLVGDKVVCSAYAHELKSYGLNVGLTNYSAAYCVGLLCARRCLAKFGLDKVYDGFKDVTGEDITVDPIGNGARPFTAALDTGLKRTSTGSKVFAVLKGALDAGINVPHNEKRFVGYDRRDKKYDPEKMKTYIFGGHVSDFMEKLAEEPDLFRLQFSQYIKNHVASDDLEELYAKVHGAIRADPTSARQLPGSSKQHAGGKIST